MTESELINNGYKRVSDYYPAVKDIYWFNVDGKMYSTAQNIFRKSNITHNKYYRYFLSRSDNSNRNKSICIHQLVNRIFNGPPPKDMVNPVTDHIDGNTFNNHPSNLRWLSNIDNISHEYKHSQFREDLPDSIIPEIFRKYHNGMSFKQIGEIYKTNPDYIREILVGQKRKPAIKKYNLKPISHKTVNKKLDYFKLSEVCFALLNKGDKTYKDLSKETGVDLRIIRNIKCKCIWQKDTQEFDFNKGTTTIFDNSPIIDIFSNISKIGNTLYYES